MFSPSLARLCRGLLAPAILALSLAAFVGLTVTAPASAAGDSLTATASLTGPNTLSMTASGFASTSEYVFVYVNHADTPCEATASAENLGPGNGPERPTPNYTAVSGSFSVVSTSNVGAAGNRIVCAYLGTTVYDAEATAVSNTVTVYPCPPGDTSFTISDVQVATGVANDCNSVLKCEFGSRWGFIDFKVNTGYDAYTSDADALTLDGLVDTVLSPVSASASSGASITTVSTRVAKVEVADSKYQNKPLGNDTATVTFYPSLGVGVCTKTDGTVVTTGAGPNDYHAPAQTLKVSYGGDCQGGTATLDGNSVAVTNISSQRGVENVYPPQNCAGRPICTAKTKLYPGWACVKGFVVLAKGAKSGKCTKKTKLAKGYVCKRGKVVKKKK